LNPGQHRPAEAAHCVLCDIHNDAPHQLVWRNADLRVVLVRDADTWRDYPGFCRVIWNAHVREMTDLQPAVRSALMQVVWHVEAVLRRVLQPAKINLASLGNQVPHVHWHVIPRWADDRHFPNPVWAAARADDRIQSDLQLQRQTQAARLVQELAQTLSGH
jgi:diadenosine tetraphosphate (Ap4A) HIT family hydrolase